MRRAALVCAFVGGLVLFATVSGSASNFSRKAAVPDADGTSRVDQGLAIAPVTLDMTGKDPLLVARGSYIVNAVGGCGDCHTCPPYTDDPFSGDAGTVNAANYLAGGTNFGIAISRNITPDASGLPAGLTREEFIETIRTGIDDDTGLILQVMPWPVFRNMNDNDLNAIYEYLSAIPHAETGCPQ